MHSKQPAERIGEACSIRPVLAQFINQYGKDTVHQPALSFSSCVAAKRCQGRGEQMLKVLCHGAMGVLWINVSQCVEPRIAAFFQLVSIRLGQQLLIKPRRQIVLVSFRHRLWQLRWSLD